MDVEINLLEGPLGDLEVRGVSAKPGVGGLHRLALGHGDPDVEVHLQLRLGAAGPQHGAVAAVDLEDDDVGAGEGQRGLGAVRRAAGACGEVLDRGHGQAAQGGGRLGPRGLHHAADATGALGAGEHDGHLVREVEAVASPALLPVVDQGHALGAAEGGEVGHDHRGADAVLVTHEGADAVAAPQERGVGLDHLQRQRAQLGLRAPLRGGLEPLGVRDVERSTAEDDPGPVVEVHLAQHVARHHQRLDQLVDRLSTTGDDLPCSDISASSDLSVSADSNFTSEQFQDAVEQCVEYIRAGDIFQVVISQRWGLTVSAQPFEIYRSLRVVNPSPFMFFLRTDEVTLVGSSPEIMCRVVDGKVTVRPLAGTRPRGNDEEHDQQLAEELLADPKERAEHVMLVDLGRNDVGRVAEYGTVELSDVMVIERYSHVMHITSNVTADLREDQDAFDALAACLPAGTVSGAPKVRAMEIIDELEPHRRGPYAGAVGYVDYAGNMDTCIAIRTMVIKGGKAYVQAGGGVVFDSEPEYEYQETVNKARAQFRAVEIAERGELQ